MARALAQLVQNARTMPQQRRIDFAFFAIYCIFYAGFVALAAFRQDWMAATVFRGINLAVVYGMVLILGAIGLALMATMLRRSEGAER